MASNNAPNAVALPPFPNVHCNFNLRTEMHVLNFTGANGSVTFNSSKSSPGLGITRSGEGAYTITFPAGGIGALGWIVTTPVQAADATKGSVRVFSVDTTTLTTPFVGGSASVLSVDQADSPILNDVIGECTFLIYVVKVPS